MNEKKEFPTCPYKKGTVAEKHYNEGLLAMYDSLIVDMHVYSRMGADEERGSLMKYIDNYWGNMYELRQYKELKAALIRANRGELIKEK